MRAVVVEQWGGPEQLVEREVERPEPGLNEVLVRVHAAGVNPVDWKTRASGGLIEWGALPAVGWDVSGTVEAVGPGVGILRPGDEVFGMPLFPGRRADTPSTSSRRPATSRRSRRRSRTWRPQLCRSPR
ncbi:hypothetical protein STANM309S_02878 [Streptomyces tanashiensis]